MGNVLSNTAWILSASAFNKVSSIALVFILSRYLGAADFAFFYITLFSSIAEMGLTPVLIRRIRAGEGQPGEMFAKGVFLGLCSSLAAIGLAVAGAFFLGFAEDVRLLIVIASLGLLVSFRDVTFRWFLEVPFRAWLKMRVPALLGMASELMGLVAVLAAVYLGKGVEVILAVYVLSNVPAFMLLALLSFREAGAGRAVTFSPFSILKEAFPIGLSNTLNTFYLISGSIVLYFYGTIESMGYFAIAFRLTTSLRIIPEALMNSVFPALASAREDLRQGIFSRSFGMLTLVAMPLALATAAAADEIAVFFGGSDFAPAGGAIEVLIWATAFAFLNTCARSTFNAVSLGGSNLSVSSAMGALSIALSFALIPAWGLTGAAWSLAITEAAGFALNVMVLSRQGLRLPFGLLARYGAAGLCMLACVLWLPNMFLQVLVGVAAYGGAAALLVIPSEGTLPGMK